MRLGEAQRESDFAFDQAGDVIQLLFFGTGRHDRRRAAAAQRNIDARAREFFLDDILRQAVAILPAILLRVGGAEPAAVIDFLVELCGLRAHAARTIRRGRGLGIGFM